MSFTPEGRTLEDVEKVFILSKVSTEDININEVKCIFFGDHLQRDDIVLFEVTKETLENLNTSKRICIKGHEDDSAVLVTDDKTYELKECDTTNTALMVKGRLFGGEKKENGSIENIKVEGVNKSHYEVQESIPRMRLLHEMLDEHSYDGTNDDDGYSFEDLLANVQCSENQLKESLEKLQTCVVKDKYRKVAFEFLCSCFRHLMATVDECNEETYYNCAFIKNSLETVFNQDISKYMMERFLLSSYQESSELNEKEVCKMYAVMLLVNCPKFLLEDFEEAWQLCVPKGMHPRFCQLQGLCVKDMEGKEAVVRYLPLHDLSHDLCSRLKELFVFKKKWSLEDIEPYLQDVCVGTTTVSSLLLKHTRMSTLNGTKVFSAK